MPSSISSRDPLAADEELPLLNKRVIVTAPRQYAGKLCGMLVEAGAQALSLPMIQIRRLSQPTAVQTLDEHLLDLASFSHVAFTSKNGIAAVLQRLEALFGSPDAATEQLRRTNCWALGADAQLLVQRGVTVCAPPQASTRGMVYELAERGEAAGARILCPVPAVLEPLTEPPTVPTFLAGLCDAGACAVRADVYETALGHEAAGAELIIELRREPPADVAIAFTSIAEAQGLRWWQDRAGVPTRLAHAEGSSMTVLAAHGLDTATGADACLHEAGQGGGPPPVHESFRTVDCVSKDSASFSGLVAALEEAFRTR